MSAIEVNRDVRVEAGTNGTLVVMSAWCSKCGEQVMPTSAGRCSWCSSLIVDEDQLPVKEMLAQLDERSREPAQQDRGEEQAHRHAEQPEPQPQPQPEPASSPSSRDTTDEGSTLDGAGKGRASRGAAQRAVLEAIAAGHQRPAVLAAQIGKEAKRVSVTILKLREKGLVEKVGYGLYQVTDAGRAALASGGPIDAKLGREPKAGQDDVVGSATDLEPPVSPAAVGAAEPASRTEHAESPLDLDVITCQLRQEANRLDVQAAALINRAQALRRNAEDLEELAA